MSTALCVATPVGAGCSQSATSPGMWVNTTAETEGTPLVTPAAPGSLCPFLQGRGTRRGSAHLCNELLLVQQVDLGQAVLLLQHQCKVGDAADGQLLLQGQHDVLTGAHTGGHTQSSDLAPVLLTRHRGVKVLQFSAGWC